MIKETERFPKLIIFDFDGCIVNSPKDAITALKETFELNHINVTKEEISECLMGNFDETVIELSKVNRKVKDLLSDKLKLEKVKHQNSSKLKDITISPLFPIMTNLISSIHSSKICMGIISRTKTSRIIRNLKEHKLLDFFDKKLIIGEDKLPIGINPKPSPDSINYLCDLAKVLPQSTFFIGDHEDDYISAKEAGCNFASSSWNEETRIKSSVLRLRNLIDFFVLGIVPKIISESDEIFHLLKQQKIQPFIGSGFSMEAGLGLWDELVADIVKDTTSIKTGDLPSLISQYESENGVKSKDKIFKVLREKLTIYEDPPKKHFLLKKLKLSRIWTLNFDSLIEDAFGGNTELVYDDPSLTYRSSRVQIIKMHGSINSINSKSWVFSKDSFLKFEKDYPELYNELKNDLVNHSMLFIGVSLDDMLADKIFSTIATSIRKIPLHFKLVTDRNYTSRYVEPIYIHNWSVVEELLQEWSWKLNCHTVSISGSLNGKIEKYEEDYLFHLGWFLIDSGFRIKIANGIGVTPPLLDGIFHYCNLSGNAEIHREKVFRINRVLSRTDFPFGSDDYDRTMNRIDNLIAPIGTTIYVKSIKKDKTIYTSIRRSLMNQSDCCISLGGRADSSGIKSITDTSIREGMLEEKDLFKTENPHTYIPVPFLDGFAKDKFQEILTTDFIGYENNEPLREYLRRLNSDLSPVDAARLTVACAITSCINNV